MGESQTPFKNEEPLNIPSTLRKGFFSKSVYQQAQLQFELKWNIFNRSCINFFNDSF